MQSQAFVLVFILPQINTVFESKYSATFCRENNYPTLSPLSPSLPRFPGGPDNP